jgi:hypothetical protein
MHRATDIINKQLSLLTQTLLTTQISGRHYNNIQGCPKINTTVIITRNAFCIRVCLSRLQLTLQTQLQYRCLKVASNHQGKSAAETGSAYIRILAWEEWLYVGQVRRAAWCVRLTSTLNQLPRIKWSCMSTHPTSLHSVHRNNLYIYFSIRSWYCTCFLIWAKTLFRRVIPARLKAGCQQAIVVEHVNYSLWIQFLWTKICKQHF